MPRARTGCVSLRRREAEMSERNSGSDYTVSQFMGDVKAILKP